MSTSAEQNSKQSEPNSQSSQAMPATDEYTIDKVKRWNRDQLLDWIQKNLANPLDNEDEGLFLKAKIGGNVFLNHKGDTKYFEEKCKLAPRTSEDLAQLAKNLAELVKDDHMSRSGQVHK
jgi:hypothetical protein